MSKLKAFSLCNEVIAKCNGRLLKLNDTIAKAELDPLGYLLVTVKLNKEYGILKGVAKGKELTVIRPSMTMKQVANLCVLSL